MQENFPPVPSLLSLGSGEVLAGVRDVHSEGYAQAADQ
jgi:hypothetical protein